MYWLMNGFVSGCAGYGTQSLGVLGKVRLGLAVMDCSLVIVLSFVSEGIDLELTRMLHLPRHMNDRQPGFGIIFPA